MSLRAFSLLRPLVGASKFGNSSSFIKNVIQQAPKISSSFFFSTTATAQPSTETPATPPADFAINEPQLKIREVTGTKYKKEMRSLMLKVHPDLFASFPQARAINDDSLSKLNDFLEWAEKFVKEPVNSEEWIDEPVKYSFVFHIKDGEKLKRIASEFDMPVSHLRSQRAQRKVEKAALECTERLLRQAGILR